MSKFDGTRIVYASFDRFPSAKGAATHIDAFARSLGNHFGHVDLLTVPPESMEVANDPKTNQVHLQDADDVSPEPWHADGVTHHPLFAPGVNLFERVLSFRARCGHWWRKHIDPSSLPIVHFRSIYEGYPIAREKDRHCRKVVFEVNGLPSIELKYRYPDVADDDELLRKLKSQEDICLRAADLVLTVSRVNAEHLYSRGVEPHRVRVIPNGVDTDLFCRREPFETREIEIAAGSPMRMLYSGTMSAWQGVGFAIEALALYRRDYAATLTLVGTVRPRQKRELLQRAYELGVFEHVHLLDPVSKHQLAELHRKADVIVAPLTRNDRNLVQGCCPLKVLEAMSSATPLIASDLPVVGELVNDDTEAMLVRPGSGKAIKDAMLRLRSEPNLGERLGTAARARAEQEFRWERAQGSLINAYESMLGMSAEP